MPSTSATPPPLATSYEAESAANTLAGGAVVASCPACSGGAKVGFVGSGGILTFNGVTAPSTGTYQVTIAYTIQLANPAAYAPDFDRIIVASSPG